MSRWPLVRLEDLAAKEKSAITKPYGSAILQEDYLPDGIPVVRGVNLAQGRFHDDDFVFISEELAHTMPGAELLAGDLVFTHRGSVGQVSMIPRKPKYSKYAVSTSQVKVRLDPVIAHPEFYYYWFQSSGGQRSILQGASTVGVPGLAQPVATVKSLLVPHPSLLEQRAIAATLGALDDKIDSNRRIIHVAEHLGAAILDRYLERNEDGVLYEDKLTVGDKLTVLETGSRPPGGAESHGTVSLGAGNIESAGVCGKTDFKRVSDQYAASMKRGRLAEEDILVYKDGGRPGNFIPHVSAFGFGFPVNLAVINEHVFRVRAAEPISQALLYWVLRSSWMDEAMRQRGTGVAIPGLNSSNFRSLPWPVISRTNLQQLNTQLQPMLRVILATGAQSHKLAALRDTLLPELLYGRIQVAAS